MSYIESARKRFPLHTDPAERLQRAAAVVAEFLESDLDRSLLELYGFLAVTAGTRTTREDVHDAWVVWQVDRNAAHQWLVPFEHLAPEIQALNEPYVDAIHRAARGLTRARLKRELCDLAVLLSFLFVIGHLVDQQEKYGLSLGSLLWQYRWALSSFACVVAGSLVIRRRFLAPGRKGLSRSQNGFGDPRPQDRGEC